MRRITKIVVVGALLASCASAEKEQGAATPVKETAVAGARIRGGGIRMDVQVGRHLTTRPAKAGTVTATPNAAVKP